MWITIYYIFFYLATDKVCYKLTIFKEKQRVLELQLHSVKPTAISNAWSIFKIEKESEFDVMESQLKMDKDFRELFVSCSAFSVLFIVSSFRNNMFTL